MSHLRTNCTRDVVFVIDFASTSPRYRAELEELLSDKNVMSAICHRVQAMRALVLTLYMPGTDLASCIVLCYRLQLVPGPHSEKSGSSTIGLDPPPEHARQQVLDQVNSAPLCVP
eukprot:2994009-Rhodomonas_salina.1